MDEDYRVPSKSNEDIERIADAWRSALCDGSNPPSDVLALLAKAGLEFRQTMGLEVIEKPDQEMGRRQAYAISEDKSHRIFVRLSIVQQAKNQEPYAIGTLEHFSIRLGVSRVCEISFAFFFGNRFEKGGDCSPKLLNCARLHFA
jgi:hypothetical protein